MLNGKPNPGWQPHTPRYAQQQQQQQQQQQALNSANPSLQRPLHPSISSTASAARSTSPQPTSPVSPRNHTSTAGSGATAGSGGANAPIPAKVMEIACRHYEALQVYLLTHILKEKHGVSEQRIAAREKLSKLLQNQLQDLSTDVYDELMRRKDGNKIPFLPVRDDYHPKRNQARQKLATLPQNRFKDLASDVYVQLERQFPELLIRFPLKNLEEKEFAQQHVPPPPPPPPEPSSPYQSDREPTTPVVQQSNVVPEMATFTIQTSSDDDYYRSQGSSNTLNGNGSAPASPTALEGNVTFSSLDSLMADIGSVPKGQHAEDKGNNMKSASAAASPSVGLGIDTGLTDTEKIKKQYEERIQILCKRLQHLESEVGDGINRPEGSRLAQVERQLAKQAEAANETNTRLTKLQLEYNKVLNDYHSQLETVDLVQQEIKSLLMETKDLKQKHLDAEDELQLAYKKIKQLEDDNADLKSDLDAALDQQSSDLAEIKALKAELNEAHDATAAAKAVASKAESMGHHQSMQPPAPAPIPAPTPAPAQQQQHQHQHQQQPPPPPPSQQQQQHHRYDEDDEDSAHAATQPQHRRQDSDDWQQTRQQNRQSMVGNPNSVIHPESLNNFRNAIDDLLAAGRSDTSQDVLMSMKSVVVACKVVTEDVEDYEHATGYQDTFVDLKQELSSGLTQLMSAAKAHSNSFEADEDAFERSLSALEAAGDQLEAIVMDMVQVPKMNMNKAGGGGAAGRSDNKGGQQGHASSSGYNDQYDDDEDDGYDDHHPRKSVGQPTSNMHDQHDNSRGYDDIEHAQDLKVYLEKQTVHIVSSIQEMLQHLRSNSEVDQICRSTEKVIEEADYIIRTTRDAMANTGVMSSPAVAELRSQGDLVLEDLENAVEDLNVIKNRLEREPELATVTGTGGNSEPMPVKQQLGNVSLDIAGFAKELVGLIDDE
ncbi:component of the polarisome [Actinomortierella ambigua]|uniref:Component of the polarisome n=1 Tax=Actinomortierella ambigua TaxID=1343610 RepID=A0A9P6QHH0_9FUNG|nr:component of the polarisome [Actinomortierella ambigua]